MSGSWRRDSTNPIVSGHQELIDLAQQVIKRALLGHCDIAAELVAAELRSKRVDRAFGLALALGEEALAAVWQSREDAIQRGVAWMPVMPEAGTGRMLSPAEEDIHPIVLAMRLLDALHRRLIGDQHATKDLGKVYETALTASEEVFFGFYDALILYAVSAQRGDITVTVDNGGSEGG